jgi:hypothetical protein
MTGRPRMRRTLRWRRAETRHHTLSRSSSRSISSIPHKSAISHLSFTLTPPALVNKESWTPGSKLVPLQKGVNKDKFECALFKKEDVLVNDGEAKDEEDIEMEEGGDTSSHTVEELKQINQQHSSQVRHLPSQLHPHPPGSGEQGVVDSGLKVSSSSEGCEQRQIRVCFV